MITPDDAKIIASRGGGLILDATKFTPDDLMVIASRAADGGGLVILRNAGRITPDDAKIIASRGGGKVVLDYVA